MKEFDGATTVMQDAQSIRTWLTKATVASRVDSQLVDAGDPIEHDADAKAEIVTLRDADGVDIIRHSCAHLLSLPIRLYIHKLICS